jgi:hypothetical protein
MHLDAMTFSAIVRRKVSFKAHLQKIGQANTIKDIMYFLNLYGFILPPQGFIYHTGHSMQPLEDVRRCFFENRWLQAATVTMAHAMVQLIRATKPLAWVQMQHTLESS